MDVFVNKHFANFVGSYKSRILRIRNVKFLGYYFYTNKNIQGGFQICISVPLKGQWKWVSWIYFKLDLAFKYFSYWVFHIVFHKFLPSPLRRRGEREFRKPWKKSAISNEMHLWMTPKKTWLLYHYGIRGIASEWSCSYLKKRKQFVCQYRKQYVLSQ